MHASSRFQLKRQGKSRRGTSVDLNITGFWLLQWLAMSNQCEPRQRIISRVDDAEVMTAGVTNRDAFDNNPTGA
jgi:hypothetical protein